VQRHGGGVPHVHAPVLLRVRRLRLELVASAAAQFLPAKRGRPR
jgi:hypothetical protein